MCGGGRLVIRSGEGRYTPRQASEDISLRRSGTSEFKDLLSDEGQGAAAALLTHTFPQACESPAHRRGHASPAATQHTDTAAGGSEFKARGSGIRALGARRGPARHQPDDGEPATPPLRVSGASPIK